MTFPLSNIKTALYNFIEAATGHDSDKIIFAYQGGPEPQGSYISIIPALAVSKPVVIDEQYIEANGDITVARRRDVTAQIDAYGPDALTLITAVQDGMDTPEHYAEFTDLDFHAEQSSQIRNLSAVKNIRFEERFNLDILIHATYTGTIDSSVYGWFDTIKSDTSTLNPPLGEITVTGA